MTPESQKKTWRRYRLHQHLKKAGISYGSGEKTIFLPALTDLSDKQKTLIEKMLRECGYVIQTEIPHQ